jgi:isoquinoline 1-oxidoreductase beta subunit
MENNSKTSRRNFLQSSASAVSGLLLAFHLPAQNKTAETIAQTSKNFAPNAFLNIGADNKITVWVTRSEMGQGVRTALPMMLADELEADWANIELKQAIPGAAFKGIRLRTSGSGSIYGTWFPLRMTGAAAREMLITAAAAKWNVPADECRAEKGTVLHVPTNRRQTYGELAEAASKLPLPEKPKLKDAKDFRLIGKPMKRVDGAGIVSGKAVYGLDVKVAGMRYALLERAPVLGGKAIRWDDAKTKSVAGVLAVVPVTKGFTNGVAVVAETTWAAMKGRDALTVVWDDSPHKNFSSGSYAAQLRSALDGESYVTRKEGEVEKAFQTAATTLEAVYEYPFQAHAPLETMNCVADVKTDFCEIWSSTQAPEQVHQEAAKMLGLAPENVKVNVTLLGGGFGRRLQVDYALEAVEISKAINAPVQIVWTREDDMKYGFFHSSTVCRLRAGLDANKKLTVFTHKTASSDLSVLGPPARDAKKYSEGWTPWGAFDNPYAFAAYQAEYIHVDSPVPTGPWRAVFYPQNVFARESFIDEIAFALGKDPIQFRLELLDAPTIELPGMKIERADLRKVLETAREKSGWSKPLAQEKGVRRGRGVACNVYHGESLSAQVAEVAVSGDGKIKVERIVCVIDCGQVVNPLGLAGQIESGIVWGLSPALKKPITFKNGRAEQSSFVDFDVLRMSEMPRVEVYTIEKQSRPFGIGEPSVPPVAPAMANAIFNATGKRLRKLPFDLNDRRL